MLSPVSESNRLCTDVETASHAAAQIGDWTRRPPANLTELE